MPLWYNEPKEITSNSFKCDQTRMEAEEAKLGNAGAIENRQKISCEND